MVDGSSYLFRAYYALPLLSNTKGQATGAILGVINMLKKLLATYKPTWVVVVFDSKQPTFRHELFPDYKINRTKIPEDLASQIPLLLEIIQALGLNILQIPGVEADDIIGSIVHHTKEEAIFNLIATGDKDFAQLVNEDVVLINTMTNVLLDPAGVINKFHVPASKMIDYLVLIGDQVDNIPGVPNIGPKTAVKLLEQYGDLDNIIQHSSQIVGKVGENLRAAMQHFPLYLKLITIHTQVEFKWSLHDFTIKNKDYVKLQEFFTELEFHALLKELELTSYNIIDPTVTSQTSSQHLAEDLRVSAVTLDLDALLAKWVQIIADTDLFAIQITTNNINPLQAGITGIYLATINDHCYLKLENFNELISTVKLNRNKNVKKYAQANNLMQLLGFLQHPDKIKVTYNLKHLCLVLDNYAIKLEPTFFDVMLEAYVLNSITRINVDPASMDAARILALHNNLLPKIKIFPQLYSILTDIEIPLSLVLKKMERTGVLIDVHKLNTQSKEVNNKLRILEKIAYDLAGAQFNLNSPKQLQEILYTKLGLPILEKTPTGQPSTSEPVLQELSLEFELPTIILQYRTLSKLQSTYIEKLPKVINSNTGRIHTSYNQAITVTGRLSSSDPNLQNIPIRTPEGKSIREAFIARAGYKILSVDYSQIELRILAHLSEDLGLIKAFQDEVDIHTMTAAEIFHLAIDNVTEELRRKAKAINFGLMYGMSDFGLAKQLKISRKEAEDYIRVYFLRFPRVLDFMESTKQFAAANGFVETMFGRRIYLPDINSKNKLKKRTAERAAINAPMQGGQADLIKLAMIKIDHWLHHEDQDIFMLMQVHDELVFEIPDDLKTTKVKPDLNRSHLNDHVLLGQTRIQTVASKIASLMQSVATLKVELKVEMKVGDSWGGNKIIY